MGKLFPRIPRDHSQYHGHTVRGTTNCPLIQQWVPGCMKVPWLASNLQFHGFRLWSTSYTFQEYLQALSNTSPQSRSLRLIWINQTNYKENKYFGSQQMDINGHKWTYHKLSHEINNQKQMLLAAQKSLSFWRPSRSSGLKQPQQLVGDGWKSKLTSRISGWFLWPGPWKPFLPTSPRKTSRSKNCLLGKAGNKKHQGPSSPY